MEFEYYYIVIIVVVLKLSIWGCVIYFRSQRARTARSQRRFVVVDSHVRPEATQTFPGHGHDQSAIVNYEEPPATSMGPPSYAEVMANPQPTSQKPPSYSQAVDCGDEDGRTPIPPHFTAPPFIPPPGQTHTGRERTTAAGHV